ncbi:precursor of CEP9-like [Cynara cardunculus var. scolymus]|uniref:precursor of CEP9-like n=1 Tax=Cynara cardunculus var. scolymus TaxID=59895 RepID=UPI000D6262C4|nr:precursor of CEP9-like [Cynara cardunculus var. scolymus]
MAEGRSLKSMKKQDNFHHHRGSHTLNAHHHKTNTEHLQASPTGGVLRAGFPVAEKRVAFPPQAPTKSEGDGNAKLKFINGFRPTMPGKSPGAGHSFTEHRLDTQSEALDSVSSIHQSSSEHDNDFRPAGPGHSPGAGHSIHN